MSQTVIESAAATTATDTTPSSAPVVETTPAAAPAAAPVLDAAAAPNPDTATQVDWREAFPPEKRELLSQFESMDDVVKAIERGKGYNPIQKPEDASLKFPEGIDIPAENQQAFKQMGVDLGLTGEQLQGVADYQIRMAQAAWDQSYNAGMSALKQLWGAKYQENAAIANKALVMLDRKMGGRLAPVLTDNSALNDPIVIEALHIIGTSLSEDTLAGASAGAIADDKVLSDEEYMRQVVFSNNIEE